MSKSNGQPGATKTPGKTVKRFGEGPNFLRLTIKRQYFDDIAEGKQTIEHREPNNYLLKNCLHCDKATGKFICYKKVDGILFVNGRTKDAPKMLVEVTDYDVMEYMDDKGQDTGRYYFEFDLGHIIKKPYIES